jgi:hypothetical protein
MNPFSRGRSSIMRVARLLPLVLLVSLAACGDDDDDNGPTGTPVDYAGPFASQVSAGIIEFGYELTDMQAARLAATAPIAVSGALTFTTATEVTLSGTLDGTLLALAGSGYEFTGTATAENVFSGTFTGPDGESGTFTAALTSDDAAVTVLCGAYEGDDEGAFSLALLPDRTGGVIVGSETGQARPKSGTTDQVEILPDAEPTLVIATGTLSSAGDAISGTWSEPEGGSGTFQGSVAACTSAPPSDATSYLGFMIGHGPVNGGLRLDFTAPPSGATTLAATSAFTPTEGSAIPLVGEVDAVGNLTATGGGYTLTGLVEDDRIIGTWLGGGGTSGQFAAAANTLVRPAVPYCGRYTPSTQGLDQGGFNVLIFGATAFGIFEGDPLDSPVSASFVGAAAGGAIYFDGSDAENTFEVNGTYNSTTASGSFNYSSLEVQTTISGTFNAPRCPGT